VKFARLWENLSARSSFSGFKAFNLHKLQNALSESHRIIHNHDPRSLELFKSLMNRLLKHRAILPRRGINGKNLEEEEEEPRKTRKMKRKMELEELS